MELLFEIIFELIVEGSTEVAKSQKVSKWIRYPIILLLSLFIIFIIGLIGYISIVSIFNNDLNHRLVGVILLIFDIFLVVSSIIKIKSEINNRKNKL